MARHRLPYSLDPDGYALGDMPWHVPTTIDYNYYIIEAQQ